MVNTLNGSVSAYRKEIVKPRFIRIDEVMALLDVTRDEAMDIAYGLKTRVYTSDECRNRYFELFGKKGTYDLNAAGVVNGTKVYQRLLIRRVTKE